MHRIDPDRLAEALRLAASLHAEQRRKGTRIPYVSHLLAVAALVLEHGGDTDQAIAALLHDAVEDCPEADLAAIRERFGDRVARIVENCTDTAPGDRPDAKSPWEERKRRYVLHLASASPDSVLVSVCDKRHNLASLVADLDHEGLRTLSRFKASPDRQLWFFEEIVRVAGDRVPERLRHEMEDLVARFAEIVRAARQ